MDGTSTTYSSQSAGAIAAPLTSERSKTRQLLSDYLELTKPKVQSLLLLTTVAAMEIAGNPKPGRIALACVGGYLSAGGAGAVKDRKSVV